MTRVASSPKEPSESEKKTSTTTTKLIERKSSLTGRLKPEVGSSNGGGESKIKSSFIKLRGSNKEKDEEKKEKESK
jgi:hypothetical protein